MHEHENRMQEYKAIKRDKQLQIMKNIGKPPKTWAQN